MFKILILQALNDLSDERAEFLITDRLGYMRFLGLGLGDKAPDRNTIWTFREALKKAGVIDDRLIRAVHRKRNHHRLGRFIRCLNIIHTRHRGTLRVAQAILKHAFGRASFCLR